MQKKPIILMTLATDTGLYGLTRVATYRNYAESFAAQGAAVLGVTDPDPDTAAQLAAMADGLFLTGGVDVDPSLYGETAIPECGRLDPWRDGVEAAYWKAFWDAGKPIFGICRGLQVINVLLGGTLYQDLPAQLGLEHPHNTIHTVRAMEGTFLREAFGAEFTVNSFHHQAVKDLADGLEVCAASMGGQVVEAFRHKTRPILAVQWHPERMTVDRLTKEGPDMGPLFRHFVEMLEC